MYRAKNVIVDILATKKMSCDRIGLQFKFLSKEGREQFYCSKPIEKGIEPQTEPYFQHAFDKVHRIKWVSVNAVQEVSLNRVSSSFIFN